MKMDEYLRKLRRNLAFRKNRCETEEILAEYKSFFETGLKEGKSEEELCESFGAPKELALELAEKEGTSFFAKQIIIRSIFLFLLVWVNLALLCAPSVNLEALLPVISGSVLWFLAGGGINSLPSYMETNRKKYKNIAVFNIITFFAAALTACYYFITVKNAIKGVIPNTAFMLFVLYGSLICFLIMTLSGVYCFIYKDAGYYPLICHAGGAFYSAFLFYRFYHNWAEPDIPFHILFILGLPYITGILTAIVFAFFINGLKRKGRI